jgi:hypothetical protein
MSRQQKFALKDRCRNRHWLWIVIPHASRTTTVENDSGGDGEITEEL